MRSQRTAAKVKAVNRAHRVAMEVWQTMHDIFAPLVGEKLDKADGAFLVKIAKLLPKLPHDHGIRVLRTGAPYSLAWEITCNEPVGDGETSLYFGISTYVGNMRDGVLTDLGHHDEKPMYRTDHTVEELLKLRADCSKAKIAYGVARTSMWPFDEEYDN